MALSVDAGEAAARLRGIALFCAAMAMFTGLDTSAKFAIAYLPALEIAWVRFFVHVVVTIVVLRPWRNWSDYRTRRPVAQVVRAVFLFLSTVFNFYALRTLRLDQATAIMFSAAFIVPALAGPILGEWIGPRRWVAVAIGFGGALVVIRPGTAAFEPAMLYSVAAMLSYVGYLLFTRHLTGTDSTAGMLLISGVVPSILLAPLALPTAVWPPTPLIAIVTAATGVFGALGHWMLIHAHRITPASVLAPFIYLQLIWMILAGYVVFREVPDRITLLGAALIVASGLYILYRERVKGPQA